MNLANIKQVINIVLLLCCLGCVEKFDFETNNFEDALVIEATITNEFKAQKILLSRTYAFEEDGPNPETNAQVQIIADNGTYTFEEVEPGVYVSENPFQAIPNINYQLFISTNNGRSYTSHPKKLTQVTPIGDVYAIRETNDNDINGMSIYVDSYDPTGNSKYYRYEYDETYKIISPKWTPRDLVVIEGSHCEVKFVDKTEEQRVCYNTVASLSINLASTSAFNEDRITRHLVRFIDRKNYILTYRYSILVRQFIQSQETFTYYETLANFNGEGSLLSQAQPGFFSGNIFSETDPLEKVIGFFDISSVSTKRIFFNYEDFFAGEGYPPYAVSCYEVSPDQYTQGGGCGGLIWGLLDDYLVYVSGGTIIPSPTENSAISRDSIAIGPFNMALKACGHCTALGSNVVPDFWEE